MNKREQQQKKFEDLLEIRIDLIDDHCRETEVTPVIVCAMDRNARSMVFGFLNQPDPEKNRKLLQDGLRRFADSLNVP